MPDFGPRWILVSNSPLGNGGQAQVYRVRDAQSPDSPEMVAKIMRGADDPARRGGLGRQSFATDTWKIQRRAPTYIPWGSCSIGYSRSAYMTGMNRNMTLLIGSFLLCWRNAGSTQSLGSLMIG